MRQYRVFGATINGSVTGGKRVAVLDGADFTLAASSGAPLTAFITGRDASSVTVRFFNKDGTEKLESDSGALVVAHHAFGGNARVVMPGGTLEVWFEHSAYWSAQGAHTRLPSPLPDEAWLEALNVADAQCDRNLGIHCAGSSAKHNVVVPVWDDVLNRLKPNWERLETLLRDSGVNGAILAAFGTNRAHVNFRFFAPHKGVLEDNAGSYSLASLCGYLAALGSDGTYSLTAGQGYATGKPSSLRAQFRVRDHTALEASVGGTVEELR